MADEVEREGPGTCPCCGEPAEWLPVDGARRGRVCRACAWVDLPHAVVGRHTTSSLLRRFFPRSRLALLIDCISYARHSRGAGPTEDDAPGALPVDARDRRSNGSTQPAGHAPDDGPGS